MNSTTINADRTRETNRITLGAGLVCALSCGSALSALVEHAVTVGLLLLVLAAGVVLVARRVARVVRWRREDRADALVADAWRAARAAETARAAAAAGQGVA